MSIISLSRRDLLAKTIATGVGGSLLSTFSADHAAAQTEADADLLRKGIVEWSERAADQPVLIKDWLAHSEVVKATKNEFASGVHGEWANDWVVEHESKKYIRTATNFGRVDPFWMGVVFHPWMHVIGYAPNRTLNIREVATLQQNTTFFERTLRFYSDDSLIFAPFPDTPRLDITTAHEDSFARIVMRSGQNPANYRLHYARFYVMAGRHGTQVPPRPLIAHGYTLRTAINIKQNLQITYSTIA
jgi:hypothetical protein